MKIQKYEIPDSGKTYKPAEPYLARVIENIRLTPEQSEDDVRNVILDLEGSGICYLEGQSVGVIPPGLQENGKPHRVRLYSIASSRTGDDGTSTTVTLCVKRVHFYNPETQSQVIGIASNYICDLKPGDRVPLIGPTGRTFFLPADDTTDLIMLAAGTGIAPFRAFINHIYKEKRTWNGKVRLFYGAKTGMESLYMNEKNSDIGQYMSLETFTAYRALSREDSPDGKRGFVQHRLAENKEEIWQMMNTGNFSLYICGMKGIELGAVEIFTQMAAAEGKDWAEIQKLFKEQGRWNIEVY
jgi:ferredoxin--NADP+ reductase